MKLKQGIGTALAILFSSFPLQQAQAALNAVDPGPYLVENGFFPAWYQDTHGLGLDLCLSGATIPTTTPVLPGVTLTGGAACTLLPNPGIFDPALPLAFPANFPDESFYFMAGANFTAGGVDVGYGADLEAAFGQGTPQAGQQIVFARIRIRITLPAGAPGGNYTVTHPYGVEVFSVAPGGGTKVINATRDIGVAAGVFTGALGGDIGPFLRDASLAPGACIPSDIAGECFVGDPNTPRPVQGSPFGTNFVRVDGPAGFASVQSDLFTVMGKVHNDPNVPLATPLLIERTTYGTRIDTTTGTVVAQQDVFVQTAPSTNAGVTATVTATDANGDPVTMTDNDANGAWYGQTANDPTSTTRLVSVTSTATNGSNTPTTISDRPLVDVVSISKAEYNAGTITVTATSSDEATPPTLTLVINGVERNDATWGPPGIVQTGTLSGLFIPPATVTVTSANGGSDTEPAVVVAP